MAAFQRTTFIPGATRVHDNFGVPIPPKTGRPMWDMPKPLKFAKHFKNAGMRAKFERGEATESEAKKAVPVYRGLDIRAFRTLRNDQRQEMKRRERRRNRWKRFAHALHYSSGLKPIKDAI